MAPTVDAWPAPLLDGSIIAADRPCGAEWGRASRTLSARINEAHQRCHVLEAQAGLSRGLRGPVAEGAEPTPRLEIPPQYWANRRQGLAQGAAPPPWGVSVGRPAVPHVRSARRARTAG